MTDEKNVKGSAAGGSAEAGTTGAAKSAATNSETKDNSQALNQTIKETATGAVGQVKEKATTALDEQKDKLTSGLTSIADELRKAGGSLRDADDKNYLAQTTARYGENLAEKVESLSGYLEHATLKDLTRDLESFARRQPALFIGGALIAGVLAARFLKSSAPKQNFSRQLSDKNGAKNNAVGGASGSKTELQSV